MPMSQKLLEKTRRITVVRQRLRLTKTWSTLLEHKYRYVKVLTKTYTTL